MRKMLFLNLLTVCLAWQSAQGQWIQTSGLHGDTVTCMAVKGTTLFAGTEWKGIFCSWDNGETWTNINAGLPPGRVSALAASDSGLCIALDGVGLYSSGPHGFGYWTDLNLPVRTVNSIAASATRLFAATDSGLFRSADNGRTWWHVPFFGSAVRRVVICPPTSALGDTVVFAESNEILFRSTNDGWTWTAIIPFPCDLDAVAMVDSVMYVSFTGTAGARCLARSTDRGLTWADMSLPEWYGPGGLVAVGTDLYAGAAASVFAPASVFRSSDAGITWADAGVGLTSGEKCLAGVGHTLFAGTTGGGVFFYAAPDTQWFPSGVPGHEVFALAASGLTITAGSDSGVFRSTYLSTAWTAAGPSEMSVWSLAAGYPYQFAGTDDGVYRSSDGLNWSSVGLGSYRISALASKIPGGASLLLAGTASDGVFISTDDGVSWPTEKQGLKGLSVNCLTVKGTKIYAGVKGHGVYLSTDDGGSWNTAATGIENESVNCITNYGSSLIAGTDATGMYRSTDEGATWLRISTNIAGLEMIHAVTVDGTDLYVGTDTAGVLRSTDSGRSWTNISAGLPSVAKRVFALGVVYNVVYAGTSHGVYFMTLGGVGWVSANAGLTCSTVLAFYGATVLYAGTQCGSVHRSDQEGGAWPMVGRFYDPPGSVTALAAENFTGGPQGPMIFGRTGDNVLLLFAGTIGTGFYRSLDSGKTWTASNAGLTNLNIHALAAGNGILFAGTEDGVFRSTNFGSMWTASNAGMNGTTVYSLAVIGANIYAGTGGSGLFLSSNNGTSWTPANAGLTNTTVLCLAVDSSSGGSTICAGTDGGGVFVSSDGGGLWQAANTGLTNATVHALAFARGDAGGTDLFAGTNGGVFRSSDNGLTWTSACTGMSSTVVNALAGYRNKLFAGTDGGGVFRRPLPAVITGVVKEPSRELPTTFKLEQNFPNPFNPSTTIQFELPKSAHVTLTIYNILGQVVRTLVDEERPAGVHNVRFDAGRLASGVYFYRLRARQTDGGPAGDFVQAKKMLVLR